MSLSKRLLHMGFQCFDFQIQAEPLSITSLFIPVQNCVFMNNMGALNFCYYLCYCERHSLNKKLQLELWDIKVESLGKVKKLGKKAISHVITKTGRWACCLETVMEPLPWRSYRQHMSPDTLNTYLQVHSLMWFSQSSPERYLWKINGTTGITPLVFCQWCQHSYIAQAGTTDQGPE